MVSFLTMCVSMPNATLSPPRLFTFPLAEGAETANLTRKLRMKTLPALVPEQIVLMDAGNVREQLVVTTQVPVVNDGSQ